jgi:adenylylsulfate kinase
MKILIMGLPGSGKTWLATRLKEILECAHFNADAIRGMANDWEFSDGARIRQAMRMANIADFESGNCRIVICDFVCPTHATRDIFNADYTIWMDTIEQGRYEDTNKVFQPPSFCDLKISEKLDDLRVAEIAGLIRNAQSNKAYLSTL